ncbi:response regulator [Tropicibacter alexandrii]|uniref:response regulator n=1 Tax=Tropicibacter alexandrii TaxID=2267683 RepID=UPI000EF46310|nr:response regulator [Tropicibacter alexandrii]
MNLRRKEYSRENLSTDQVRKQESLQESDRGESSGGLPIIAAVLGAPFALMVFIVCLIFGTSLFSAFLYATFTHTAIIAIAALIAYFRNDGEPIVSQPATTPEKPASLSERIWRSYAAKSIVVAPMRVAAALPNLPISASIAKSCSELGHEVHHSNDLDEILECVASNIEEWDFVIVDMGISSDISEVIDTLISFRNQFPSMPVLLLSSDVGADDLSSERSSICDATLRKPIFKKQLALGVLAALENHHTALKKINL